MLLYFRRYLEADMSHWDKPLSYDRMGSWFVTTQGATHPEYLNRLEPGDEVLTKGEGKKVYTLKGYPIAYWPKLGNQCRLNGICWDEKKESVLAHEVGHWLSETKNEMSAWYTAAVIFGSKLILDDWAEVIRGMKAYNFSDRTIEKLRKVIEKLPP